MHLSHNIPFRVRTPRLTPREIEYLCTEPEPEPEDLHDDLREFFKLLPRE